MSTRLFLCEYHDTFSKSRLFVTYSIKYLQYWKQEYAEYASSFSALNDLLIRFTVRLAELSSAIQDCSHQDEREVSRAQIEKVLYEIERKMDSISFSLPALGLGWQLEMECICRLFDYAYQELLEVLGSFKRYTYSLYEKLEILEAVRG
ncbi:hypothetical protein [Paenibacillus glycanilyticus]|uniref:Uncharacterized protein n=1 Tax=Paenibacillus glycanilyticus TaxID=126569 RepID=A0ABQ6G9Y8_9BACL|nr:hypothetical protein [Paenibacillus glycanilyticus]GLX67754.1 hypothetical protein MU1_20990 [Paenibacillus glycanilyticus]